MTGELQYVTAVLNDIHASWRAHGPALMVHPAAGFGMWPNVQKNLDTARISFQETRKQLLPVLESVSRGSSFLGLNKSAWKLGMRVRTLGVYRERFRAHYQAFKVSATMLRMYVCRIRIRVTNDAQILKSLFDLGVSTLKHNHLWQPSMQRSSSWRQLRRPQRRTRNLALVKRTSGGK